ncbi:transposase [Streptomyces mirabilis]|uniref:transposase n=1 Tax=Streptomyces mirabilis TaxID=68239 RepID=UPI0036AF1ACC
MPTCSLRPAASAPNPAARASAAAEVVRTLMMSPGVLRTRRLPHRGNSPWSAACPVPAARASSSWPTVSSSVSRCGRRSPPPEPICCGGCPPTASCPSTSDFATGHGSPPSMPPPTRPAGIRSRSVSLPTSSKTPPTGLVTSLLDARRYPARHLAALYRERWEIESVFAEIKTHQRGAGVVLSSNTPDGVRQQIWAHLLVHHALRELILRTAATRQLDPDRVSFTETLRSARRSVTVTQGSFSPSPPGQSIANPPTGPSGKAPARQTTPQPAPCGETQDVQLPAQAARTPHMAPTHPHRHSSHPHHTTPAPGPITQWHCF